MEEEFPILKKILISDEPEIERDYFRRRHFAIQISNVIVSRNEPSSIVIGIYGEWGEGKTTLLNFIEKELKKYENIICIRYNPWYYSDEVTLLQDFFNVLAEKLRNVSYSNDLKAQIKKYGKHISQFATSKSTTINLGPLQFNPFSLDSFLDLAESKKEIQAILKKCDVRIVVLMDDIDRLEKTEIQSIFKLVKLSADFNYLDYILAFDEEMVASAIGEKYGSKDIESGRNFLEKIINVPIHLPQPSEKALFNFLRDGLENNVLPILQIKLKKEEYETFLVQFKKGLQVKLKTPRMVKRYQNALIFSLPLLEGEVNIVDLMLIEGIRVFYPRMYNVIKNNPEIFINIESSFKNRLYGVPDKINMGFEDLSIQENESLKDLLCYLFPELQIIFTDIYSNYPTENQQLVTKRKRIASLCYFNRYFSYTIPVGDISDLEIDHFIESINRIECVNDREIEEISSQIIELINANNPDSAGTFISKIDQVKNKLNLDISEKLILALSNISENFPKDSCLYIISNILLTMPLATRLACCKKMIESTRSICFALSVYYIAKSEEMQFSATDAEYLMDEIQKRINDEIILESEPIYVRYPCGGFILKFLYDCECKKLNKYIEKTFSLNPIYSIKFLECFCMEKFSSVGKLKTFESENYDVIKDLIDPDILYNKLQIDHPDILENSTCEKEKGNEDDEGTIVLKRFAQIHNGRKQENTH